jgi:hypothetical protein
METNIPNLYLAGVVCGGKDTHLWFIENSRIHADMIIKDILSKYSKGIFKPFIDRAIPKEPCYFRNTGLFKISEYFFC